VKAAADSGRVVQVGTQNRSNKLYIHAKKMVEDGVIGEVHYVRAFWYRNFDPNGRVPAAWRYEIPADASPETSDWERFLGNASKRPWDKRRYFQWRNYWDYSSGISTDLLVHQTDITNFVLNKGLPSSCVASGGIYMWGAPDDREVPDTLSATYEYPNDRFQLNYSCYFGNDHYGYGEQFMGYKGTIEVMDRQNLLFSAQPKFLTGAKFSSQPDLRMNYLKDFQQPDATAAHVRNFLMAVLGKEKPIAPAEVGQIAAIPGHMATRAYRENRKVYWPERA